MGKALREQVPRSSHGEWQPAPDHPQPVVMLQESNQGRLRELVPIRYGRMLKSPFAFSIETQGVCDQQTLFEKLKHVKSLI